MSCRTRRQYAILTTSEPNRYEFAVQTLRDSGFLVHVEDYTPSRVQDPILVTRFNTYEGPNNIARFVIRQEEILKERRDLSNQPK